MITHFFDDKKANFYKIPMMSVDIFAAGNARPGYLITSENLAVKGVRKVGAPVHTEGQALQAHAKMLGLKALRVRSNTIMRQTTGGT